MMDESAPAEPTVDAYADKEAIKRLVKQRIESWSNPRPRFPFLMAAERNIHYKHGNQWIVPLGGGNVGWRPAILKKGTPQPVTNVFSSTLKTFSSLLARFEPVVNYRPATAEPADQATADVASRVNEVCEDEVKITPIRQLLAEWVTYTGGAWLETGYDNDPRYGMRDVPMCPGCQAQAPMEAATPPAPPDGMADPAMMGMGPPCPECGTAMAEQNVPMPRGAMSTDVVSLFEMLFDPLVTDPTKHRALCRIRSFSPEDAKARWKDLADQITPDSTPQTRLTADALSMITPNVDANPSQQLLSSAGGVNSRVTEFWYSQLPDATYPEGLLAITIGRSQRLLAWSGPLPYYAMRADGSKDPFLNYVFFPQEFIPGSAWPNTVANDVALKQKQRNKFESAIEQMAGRMANPIWIWAQGANVRSMSGEIGQIVEWSGLTAHGEPKRVQGLPINPSMVNYIDRIDSEIQDLANIFDVMSGNRPEGISAGISLQILKERGESRFGPMFILWNHAWAEWSRQMIEIFRQHATEERLLAIKGRDGAWEVKKFMGADLQGRVNVVPEAGATMPRSTMTERAEMEQAATIGAINPAGNIEDRIAYLTAMGMLHKFMPGMALDTKRAFMENEAFEQLSQMPEVQAIRPDQVAALRQFVQQAQLTSGPVVALQQIEAQFQGLGIALPTVRPAIDDHAVHGREQRNFAKSERFDALHQAVQVLVELHIGVHDYLAAQQMQAVTAARQGTNPAGGFMAPPGPRQAPMSAGSSPQRMDGDNQEMESKMARMG